MVKPATIFRTKTRIPAEVLSLAGYLRVPRYMYRIDAVRGMRGTAWVAVRGTKVLMKRGTRYVGKGSYSKILNDRHPLARGC